MRPNSDAKKTAFLAAYRKSGYVYIAAKAAGVERDAKRYWCNTDPEFAAQFDDAKQAYTEYIVERARKEAVRRAIRGVKQRSVTKDGEIIINRRYSDKLLDTILRSLDPEFKPRQAIEHSGPDGAAIEFHRLTDTELERIASGSSDRIAGPPASAD